MMGKNDNTYTFHQKFPLLIIQFCPVAYSVFCHVNESSLS